MIKKKIFLLLLLVSSLVPCAHGMKEAESFVRGAVPTIVGMGLGHVTFGLIDQHFIGQLIGGFAGATVDHCYLGGKEDLHQGWRKAGNIAPFIEVGCNKIKIEKNKERVRKANKDITNYNSNIVNNIPRKDGLLTQGMAYVRQADLPILL